MQGKEDSVSHEESVDISMDWCPVKEHFVRPPSDNETGNHGGNNNTVTEELTAAVEKDNSKVSTKDNCAITQANTIMKEYFVQQSDNEDENNQDTDNSNDNQTVGAARYDSPSLEIDIFASEESITDEIDKDKNEAKESKYKNETAEAEDQHERSETENKNESETENKNESSETENKKMDNNCSHNNASETKHSVVPTARMKGITNEMQLNNREKVEWTKDDKQWFEDSKGKLQEFINNYQSEENGKYEDITLRNYILKKKPLETWKLRDICCLSLMIWCKDHLVYTNNVSHGMWYRFATGKHPKKWQDMVVKDTSDRQTLSNDKVLAKGINMLSLWWKEGIIPQSQNIRSR